LQQPSAQRRRTPARCPMARTILRVASWRESEFNCSAIYECHQSSFVEVNQVMSALHGD
jgi:hypothetical protein